LHQVGPFYMYKLALGLSMKPQGKNKREYD